MRYRATGAAPVMLAPPARAQAVSFAGADVMLTGRLFRPDGSAPFPAVVALHGCGGLFGRDGTLDARHSDWGERLSREGFIVLMPDSFGPRGLASQCATKERTVRAWRERVEDAVAAKAFLQSRSDVKVDAISLLGWSNGGTTVLHAVDRRRGEPAGTADFACAIAFYPGCRALLESGNWHARLPLLILVGEADDWTAAAPCRRLAEAAAAAGDPVTIKLYPGAHHGFDAPGRKVRTRKGLAFTVDGTGVAHVGTDPSARLDAIARVPAFLAR